MKLKEILRITELIVNDLTGKINKSMIDLKTLEEEILKHINKIGSIMEQEILENINEPTIENRIIVNNEEAVFSQKRNLRFKNRFGAETVIARRCYKYLDKEGDYCPLDEKIGMKNCFGFSPLMTYLQSLYGGELSYANSSNKLSATIGFSISSTAIQNNTEKVGALIKENPLQIISTKEQNRACDLMLVEIDGTMSPQIQQKDGISGRESLKNPTEYKEANIIVIEKYNHEKELLKRWTGAKYGPRNEFNEYVRKASLKIGYLKSQRTIFISDGAKHNWEIQMNNFPDAIPILDFYHATEHLSKFCELFKDQKKGKKMYSHWYSMLYEGEILQVLSEMKDKNLDSITNSDSGQKEINYFSNNKQRMNYGYYREKGYPVGSGLVEGHCKLVIKKRFKGNGMRWKKKDNSEVLRVRLSIINGQLERYFHKRKVA